MAPEYLHGNDKKCLKYFVLNSTSTQLMDIDCIGITISVGSWVM